MTRDERRETIGWLAGLRGAWTRRGGEATTDPNRKDAIRSFRRASSESERVGRPRSNSQGLFTSLHFLLPVALSALLD